MRRLPALLGAVALSVTPACLVRGTAPAREGTVRTGRGTFVVRSDAVDAASFDAVVVAVRKGEAALSRWGHFKEPVRVNVLPDRQTFDAAVGEGGFPGRRGFARYDDVFLLSPENWSALGARQAEVEELVLHELTHCLMYQRAGSRTQWRRKGIPLWFREGMASYIAHQAYRWKAPDIKPLSPDASPFAEAEEVAGGDVRRAYGLAHYAFQALVNRRGEDGVRALLRAMERGVDFPGAFEEVYGLPPRAFTRALETSLDRH